VPTVAVYNTEGQQVGEIDLNERIFGAEVNPALLHQAVVTYRAALRRGTASTKTRAEVRGGGRKPWRQKGTGMARHGTRRSPLWRGGGIVFGPKPRDYTLELPKKARKVALCSALSAKVRDGSIRVLESWTLAEPKTKMVASVLSNLNINDGALIVIGSADRNLQLSSRNLPDVSTVLAENLNAYDVLRHENLVLTKDAVDRIEEVLAR